MIPSSDTAGAEPRAAEGEEVTGLRRLADVAATLGETRLQDEALQLAERATAGRFHVACVGQFKRGKSTLLNALVGDAVLPAGVVPVTAVPTIVRYGQRGARVRLADGGWRDVGPGRLADYVAEASNPENVKGVLAAEVLVPSALLASGMCLVDTPGLGSVFQGNAAATRAFVPHVDAALVVLGADPPIGGDELALVRAVAAEVADLIVVLNKADRTSDRERADAAAFTRDVLEGAIGRPIGPVHEVSGLERLEGRGPARDWPQLMHTLEALARESGATLARQAVDRGRARLRGRLLHVVEERQSALTRPLSESEARVAALENATVQADRWLRDLAGVMAGEQRRVLGRLEADRVRFMAAVLPVARRDLDERLSAHAGWWGPRERRVAMGAAVDVARARIEPWLDAQRASASAAFTELADRFTELEREFAIRLTSLDVRGLADEVAWAPPQCVAPETAFQFQAELRVAEPASPVRHAADVVLAVFARRAFRRSANHFLRWLLETNSWRVQSEVVGRLDEGRRRLERHARAVLEEAQASASRALAHARSVRARGAEGTRVALARLGEIAGALRGGPT